MSGDELSEDQPEVSCELGNISQNHFPLIRDIILEACKDPYRFVLYEKESQK